MLDQRSTVAQFCMWIHSVVDTYTNVAAMGSSTASAPGDCSHLITRVRKFLVIWSGFSIKVLKQLKMLKTSTSSASKIKLPQLIGLKLHF